MASDVEFLTYRLDDTERISNSPKAHRIVDAILIRMVTGRSDEFRFEFESDTIRVIGCMEGHCVELPAPPLEYRAGMIQWLTEIAGFSGALPPGITSTRIRLVTPLQTLEPDIVFQVDEHGDVTHVHFRVDYRNL